MNKVGVLALICFLSGLAGVHAVAPAADQAPLAQAILSPDLISDSLEHLLPLEVDLPPGNGSESAKAQIVDMVYCGIEQPGVGNALAIVSPEKTRHSQRLSTRDCHRAVSGVAVRLGNAPDASNWLEVVRLQAKWKPWELELLVYDSALVGKSNVSAPSLNAGEQLVTYGTSDLVLLPSPGNHEKFDLALDFRSGDVLVAVYQGGVREGSPSEVKFSREIEAELTSNPQQPNSLIAAQYSFINHLLTLYDAQYDVPVPVGGAMETLRARNPRVSGSDGFLSLAGQLVFEHGTYAGNLHTAGPDLTIKRFDLTPLPPGCDRTDLASKLQCKAEKYTLAGPSRILENSLTNYYQGSFKYSARDHPFRFNLGDREFTATFDAIRSTSTNLMAIEIGRLSIKQPDERQADHSIE